MKRTIRTCVSCGARKEKHELIRFVLDEAPVEDAKQRMTGRGAYVCDNEKCRETGLVKNRLMRSLQINQLRRKAVKTG